MQKSYTIINSKINSNIDDEWEMFLLGNQKSNNEKIKNEKYKENKIPNSNKFVCSNIEIESDVTTETNVNLENGNLNINSEKEKCPKCTSIYISTKTNISYLNSPIDIKNVFWEIPIIPYSYAGEGIIKKQIKFNSLSANELKEIQSRLSKETYFEEHIITHIDNTNNENSYNDHSKRILFKDIRKISIGLSKKDLMSYRNKKKSAFYNCFVLIIRLKIGEVFKEFHVKVFNTGKLEIPGIQKEEDFQRILNYIIFVLKPVVKNTTEILDYKEGTTETVLINSNFNCGYYVNRELFYDILRYKYNIQAIYDPCSYPGIQCKFYFNPDIPIQSGSQISEQNKELYKNVSEVSFMVFRTGSVLIVGKCDETILFKIYDFLKNIFIQEYFEIGENLNTTYTNKNEEVKKKKIRKKIMYSNEIEVNE
jgi:hypothetical protein